MWVDDIAGAFLAPESVFNGSGPRGVEHHGLVIAVGERVYQWGIRLVADCPEVGEESFVLLGVWVEVRHGVEIGGDALSHSLNGW